MLSGQHLVDLVLQAQCHSTISGAAGAALPTQGMPWQLRKLQTALDFVCDAYAPVPDSEVARLLAGVCHPNAALRMTAADMADVAWLKDIAASPLPKCPVVL